MGRLRIIQHLPKEKDSQLSVGKLAKDNVNRNCKALQTGISNVKTINHLQ